MIVRDVYKCHCLFYKSEIKKWTNCKIYTLVKLTFYYFGDKISLNLSYKGDPILGTV